MPYSSSYISITGDLNLNPDPSPKPNANPNPRRHQTVRERSTPEPAIRVELERVEGRVDDVLNQPVGGPVNILLGHGHLEGVQLLEERVVLVVVLLAVIVGLGVAEQTTLVVEVGSHL